MNQRPPRDRSFWTKRVGRRVGLPSQRVLLKGGQSNWLHRQPSVGRKSLGAPCLPVGLKMANLSRLSRHTSVTRGFFCDRAIASHVTCQLPQLLCAVFTLVVAPQALNPATLEPSPFGSNSGTSLLGSPNEFVSRFEPGGWAGGKVV